jgi:hypothetical protein
MTTRERLTQVGFPFPSEPKMIIFRDRIEGMLKRETHIPDEGELFSAQHRYESFLQGGPKRMTSLSVKIEIGLRAEDGKTTERYKNRQRERIYKEAKRWCSAAGVDTEVVMDGLFLFHRVRTCAARLHSPLTVAMICMILAEERLRKDEEDKETFVYPPSKKIRMNYGKTSRQKWIKFLEAHTYGKVQNTDRCETTHTSDMCSKKTCDIDLGHETNIDERGSR